MKPSDILARYSAEQASTPNDKTEAVNRFLDGFITLTGVGTPDGPAGWTLFRDADLNDCTFVHNRRWAVYTWVASGDGAFMYRTGKFGAPPTTGANEVPGLAYDALARALVPTERDPDVVPEPGKPYPMKDRFRVFAQFLVREIDKVRAVVLAETKP